MNKNLLTKKQSFLLLFFALFTSVFFGQSNNCAATPTLTIGATCVTTNYSITDAAFTNSGVTESCTGTSFRDGWFTFTTDATTTSITITGTSNRELGLALYSGACGSLTEITCTIPTTANASLTNVTVTPSTTYRIRLMRTNNGNNNDMTGTICVISVAAPSAAPYCTPTNTYSTSYYITNVTSTGGVANFNNNSAGFAAYSNFSAQFVSQYPGASFSLTASHPTSTYGYNVWVDWNNDNDFNDFGENVISTGYLSTPASLGAITIPTGQAPGNYRMRIRNAYLSNPAPACGSFDYGEAEDYTVRVIAPAACSGAPVAGTTTTSPGSGNAGSTYVVSASGFTNATGLTFQWQYSINGGAWTNQGGPTGTYSNYTATAPALGTTVAWHLIVTCTASGQNATSTNGNFTSVSTQNIPTTGSNTVTCGTNIVLYDNGGAAGNYANSSNGFTVLEAGLGATINISGNYVTESIDKIRIYNGTGLGGTLLATYSGTGSINYTGTAGQTLTVEFYSDSSIVYAGFTLSVSYTGVCYPVCTGTPTGGSAIATPVSGAAGSSYTVSATGFTGATGLTFQWQSNTNSAGWVNIGTATGTYSNVTATAPVLGTTVLWHLIVTCTASGQSATSTNCTFTSVSTLNVPATGNNSVACGTNIVLHDNGGASGDYANSSSGYTVLNAGVGAIINISGNYVTESIDRIRIYNGSGTAGTLLATYSGTGSVNYTGTAGQTLTVEFYSDSSVVYSGFTLSVTYTGACVLSTCSGTPTGGTATTNPNTAWPGSPYVVSATGYTQALNLTFQWQSSTNGGAWTNVGTPSSSYSNYNATAPTSGVVLWRLLITCTNSTQTATSSTGTFTTMVVSDVVTGCPNVVSGGLGLNGADPATITCVSASGCVDLEATYLNLGNTSNYIVEPIIYNPPFAFSGLANPVSVNTDDVWSPVVNLPFDFCFYGNTYNKCLIGSNGVITFDTTINNTPGGTCAWSMYGSTAANLPVSGHDALVENSIFGVFHDMNPATLGEVGWQLITLPSGCRALVVSWSNVPMYSSDSANDYTGMMVLYENSNIIEVYVKKKRITTHPGSGAEGMWNDGNAVIGIQNANGTLASVPPGRNALDTNWTATNEAWRFVPNGTSIASIKWHEGAGISGPVVGTTDVINVCPTNTTIYTAEITYTLCDGRTITEVDQTTVTVNKDKTWNGSVDTNWNVANNWTPSGVPTAAQSVNIPNVTNDPIVGAGADAYACSLSIENGGVLTINPGKNIIVTNAVTVAAGGTFNVQNSASLIQVNNVANSGIMNMQRTANIRKLDYVYWSSPVTFGSNFSSGAISPLSPSNLIFKWTPTIGTNAGGFGNWTQAVENMAVGKGYIVRGPNTFTATAAPYTATFIGTPNNGNISAPIQRGTYNGVNYNTIVSTTPGTKDDDNWNLIGNPYPSAIKAVDFLTQNTNIDGFVNIWTHGTLPSTAIIDPFYNNYAYNYTSSDYITYNSSGASSGPGTYNGYIPAGQGFFVLMKHTSAATSENVIFNNTMRSKTYDNGQFFKNTQETNSENEGRIWLDIVAANGANVRSLVAYVDGATNDRDRLFDAVADGKLSLDLYSTIAEEPMRIQGKTLPFDQNDKVPLGFKVPQNGTYTIALAAVEGFFTNTNQTIYLEDKQTNIIHDLRQNPYLFSALSGLDLNRFILRYTNETLSVDDFNTNEATVLVISANELSVKSTKNEIKSVRVYDILGRELANYPNVNGYEVSLTKIQKNNSGLIIQVTLTNGAVISKKAIY